jgi:hypothetical protein
VYTLDRGTTRAAHELVTRNAAGPAGTTIELANLGGAVYSLG